MQIMYIVLLSVGIFSQKKKKEEENPLHIETLLKHVVHIHTHKKRFFNIH